METKIYYLTKENEKQYLQACGNILLNGGLVAFPTETVYGLGAHALDARASEKIYQAKGRPSDNPLIVHIAHKQAVSQIAQNISEYAQALMDAFWPGPLTLIFEKKDIVPLQTTGGLETVAIRLPKDRVARELIHLGGGFIAAPSANLSGRPSPTSAQHVIEDLSGRIEAIVASEDTVIGLESTIIDCSTQVPTLLRPGFITPEEIEAVVGQIRVGDHTSEQAPKAPGMKYKHYAPKGELYLVLGNHQKVALYLQRSIQKLKQEGYKVGILCYEDHVNDYQSDLTLCLGTREDEVSVAARIFGALRKMDASNIEYIFSEITSYSSLGDAIMNRLYKAAGFRVISAEKGSYFEI